MARKPKKPEDMSFLLQSSQGTLAQIATKTNYLKRLDDIVQQCCPDLPIDVWHIANFKQDSLVIEVKSSVWSQRLQFERMNISRAISEFTGGEFARITIKVAPYLNKREPEATHTTTNENINAKLSEETADKLREVAQKAPKSLQERIERLANLSKQNKSR